MPQFNKRYPNLWAGLALLAIFTPWASWAAPEIENYSLEERALLQAEILEFVGREKLSTDALSEGELEHSVASLLTDTAALQAWTLLRLKSLLGYRDGILSQADHSRFLRLKAYVRLLRSAHEPRLYQDHLSPVDLDRGLTRRNVARALILIQEILKLTHHSLAKRDFEKEAQATLQWLLETPLLKSRGDGVDRMEIYAHWIAQSPEFQSWMALEWIDAIESELMPNPEGSALKEAQIRLEDKNHEPLQEAFLRELDLLELEAIVPVALETHERRQLARMWVGGRPSEQVATLMKVKDALGTRMGIMPSELERAQHRFKKRISFLCAGDEAPCQVPGGGGMEKRRLNQQDFHLRIELIHRPWELWKILELDEKAEKGRAQIEKESWANEWISRLIEVPYIKADAGSADRLEIYEVLLRKVPAHTLQRAMLLVDMTEATIRRVQYGKRVNGGSGFCEGQLAR